MRNQAASPSNTRTLARSCCLATHGMLPSHRSKITFLVVGQKHQRRDDVAIDLELDYISATESHRC